MGKSVALFYCKNISKKLKKVCKNLLTIIEKCVIIWSQSKRKAQKRKNEVLKMKKVVRINAEGVKSKYGYIIYQIIHEVYL